MHKPLQNPIIVALDMLDKKEAIKTIKELEEGKMVWGYKLSTQLFAEGIRLLDEIEGSVGSVNLLIDLQFIGTPKFIEDSVRLFCRPAVRFIVCNAAAGPTAIRRAVATAHLSTKILVGSSLSSLSLADIRFIFGAINREAKADDFTAMTRETKAAGLYCAAEELEHLSHQPEKKDIPMTAAVAIRPDSYLDKGEHVFTLTPNQAMERGARFLVIGGPITELQGWDDPKPRTKTEAVERILAGIDQRYLTPRIEGGPIK
jgi:orotidine-5'-phosphate decarboxylase